MKVNLPGRALRMSTVNEKNRKSLQDSCTERQRIEKDTNYLWDQNDRHEFNKQTELLNKNARFPDQNGDIVRIERPSTAVQRHVKKISEEFTITQTKYEKTVRSSGILIHIEPSSVSEGRNNYPGALNSIFSPKKQRKGRQFSRKLPSCTKCGPNMNQVMPLVSPSPVLKSNKDKKNLSSSQNTSGKISVTNSNSTTSPRKCFGGSKKRCSLSPSTPCLLGNNHKASISSATRIIRRRKSQSAHAGMSDGILKLPFEQVKKAKLFSEKAVKDGKVFSIHGGFPAIREAMLKRGWVEKIIYSFPYVNPHPQNCVCSHVGLHTPIHHQHQSSSDSGSNHPSDYSSLSCSSSNSTSLSQTNLVKNTAKLKSQTCMTRSKTSLIPDNLKTITAESSSEVESCDIKETQEISSMMTDEDTQMIQHSSEDDDKSLIEDMSSANSNHMESISDDSHKSDELMNEKITEASEKQDENDYIKKMSKTINTAFLGPNEIREGIQKSINRKNLSIFQYSVPPFERKRKISCPATNSDIKTSKTDEPSEELDENLNEECHSEASIIKDIIEKENVSGTEEDHPVKQPFNPYPELDYVLTDQDKPVVARVLRNVEPNLIWSWNRDSISYKHLSKEQFVNRFPNTPFTTKFGLCETLQQLHWFSEAPSVDKFVPRAYCIGHEDERAAFIHDYRTTACISILKWLVEGSETKGAQMVAHPLGEVPIRRIRQALQHVERYIQSCCHDDIDAPPLSPLRETEWEALLTAHHRIIHQDRKIKAPQHHVQSLLRDCRSALDRVEPFWPQIHMDGNRNVWIVKPGAQSRGRGIFLLNNLEEILALVQSPLIYQTKYVVQKYMERPLLIYNTKFDIRQWFLVTDWNPLTVWMYKESYLRFCSQQYDLANNDEAIHLSNNAIQCKYHNGIRDEELPEENMWDCHQFRNYLRMKGHTEAYDEIIYAGMKDALISTMLAAQVQMDSFKHGFEFFGADFMLTEDLRPWLIEINSSPCMASTTSVTKRMCYEGLQDTIKVVVDFKQNKSADTGNFELIYQDKEKSIANLPYVGVTLQVVGKQIWKGNTLKQDKRKPRKLKPMPKVMKSIPLITLKLEESGEVKPSKLCPIFDCQNYAEKGPFISAIVPESPTDTNKNYGG